MRIYSNKVTVANFSAINEYSKLTLLVTILLHKKKVVKCLREREVGLIMFDAQKLFLRQDI